MFYRFARGLFRLYFKCFYAWEIHGAGHFPARGPFIICANHTSWFDPPLVGCLLRGPNKVNFMAKEEFFKGFIVGPLFKRLGVFPVKRNTADKGAIRRALQVLEAGGILGLFPEGTRGRSGELGALHHGAALICLKSKKPVLPVTIRWPGKYFGTVRVKVGPLISFAEEGKINRQMLEAVSSRIAEELRGPL